MKTKVYLVINKKRIYSPESEIDFTGIIDIVGVYTSMEDAQKCVEEEYNKSKGKTYKGEVKWDDDNLQMTQKVGKIIPLGNRNMLQTQHITVTWTIKEMESSSYE